MRGTNHTIRAALSICLLLGGLYSLPQWDLSINLKAAHTSPSWHFPLGTDSLGRSYLALIFAAIGETVPILWLTSSLALLGGWSLGILLSCLDRMPETLRWIIKVMCSSLKGIPFFLMIFAIILLSGQVGIYSVLWGLGIIFLLQGCSQIFLLGEQAKNLLFWQAHRSLGGSTLQRLWKYGVTSGWRHQLWKQWCISLQMAIIAETALSYLGLGVQEPYISLGLVLSEQMGSYLGGHILVALSGVLFCLLLLAQVPRWTIILLEKAD